MKWYWQIVVGCLGLGLVGLAGGYVYLFAMPGSSFEGALPPVTEDQRGTADRLAGHVNRLAGDIGPRHMERPAAYREARKYLVDRLESFGYVPRLQTYEVLGLEVHNIVAEREGSTRPDEIVVVGAHYDSENGTPGADDNASGVAGALELARRFAGREPERTVRFVLFANEEAPYAGTRAMGSMRAARQAREAGEAIVVMYSLEMLGYYTDEPGTQGYPAGLDWLYPSTGDFIAFVGNLSSRSQVRRSVGAFRRAVDFPSQGIASPEAIRGVRFSDHASYWRYDYPGVMVTDTAFFRNDHYHRPSDKPSTLDYTRMARVVDGLEAVVERQASVGSP